MAHRWPFVGRAEELARIDSLVTSGVGALIVGEPGIGKTALARRAEETIGRTMPVGRVVGHAVSNGAPFEAFAAALRAADTSLLHPVEVARRVSEAFARPAGSRVLFVVDDAQLLDPRSAQVLLQLVADSQATVLATARNLQLPAGIERLWCDGWCERIELAGLTDDQVAELIEAVLGGPVDSAVARAFAGRAQGNPLLLRELVSAALEVSTLVWRGTAWTLAGEPPISSGVRELIRSRLAALPDAQRSALETVAAGEPLAISVVTTLVGESVLDELDADRLITVRTGLAGPEVSSAHPLHGEVLRADIPPLRLRRLRLSLASKLEAIEHPSPHDLVRAALWRLESGWSNDPERLLAAARAARTLSLDTAERLARHAHEVTGSMQATLLLAEILTHAGRTAEASKLTEALPPDSLTSADREALVYCAAVGQGLLTGDAGGAADLVAGVMAGEPAASDQLRGLYASLLAFDGRLADAIAVAGVLVDDPAVHPVARTHAAIAAVGAEYWLGHTRRAVALADAVGPIAATVRDVVPFGAASIELIAICALLEEGELDRAEERALRMREQAVADHDPFTGPRGEYCLARVALMRGRPTTALRGFRRCLGSLTPFDQSFLRHISSMLARAAATVGDLSAAQQSLDACADAPRMKMYEPEFELAVAAVQAAGLRMAEAADHAAWAAGLAADREQWNVALAGYHDAARYGAARAILIPLREAATHVDGTFAWCLIDHASALAARDPVGLDEVARRFEAHHAMLLAAEAAAEAALAHTAAGHPRPARASAAQAALLWARCEGAVTPWLAGAAVAVPLTTRERQIAALAASGDSDAAIADRLGISARTVQTHLARVYDKLGINRRTDIGSRLSV
ncbi:MAG TPA: LuxR C-terminal-related transcriptional regulator [Jatrophihabitans sp.]|nr:LuxR C-terminal-related transcriptional regulator [Jatrophihabitans sp.]